MRLKELGIRLLKEESGQSTTEYILILAVVVMIAMKFKEKIGNIILGATDQIETNITQTLEVVGP